MREIRENSLTLSAAGIGLFVVLAGLATLLAATPARAQSRLDLELRSLRALDPGFTAWCESGHMIFRSQHSARFRIRNSALCAGKPDGHILCTSDPVAAAAGGKVPVGPCTDISAPGA